MVQLIVVLASELECTLLSRVEGIPSDCVTFHCQTFGRGDCYMIVQFPGIV